MPLAGPDPKFRARPRDGAKFTSLPTTALTTTLLPLFGGNTPSVRSKKQLFAIKRKFAMVVP